MNNKSIRYVATNTLTTLQTSSVASGEGENFSGFSHMNAIAVVNTLTGGGTVDFSVQEWFAVSTGSTTGFFLTTAKATGITATAGAVYLTFDNNNQTGPYAKPGTQQNSMLGMGHQKQIVTSTSGTVNALNVDAVFVYFND